MKSNYYARMLAGSVKTAFFALLHNLIGQPRDFSRETVSHVVHLKIRIIYKCGLCIEMSSPSGEYRIKEPKDFYYRRIFFYVERVFCFLLLFASFTIILFSARENTAAQSEESLLYLHRLWFCTNRINHALFP